MRFKLALLFTCLMLFIGVAQNNINIEEIHISMGLQTYSAPVKNKAVTGEALSVAGVEYKTGIGVHSQSSFKIKVNGGSQFTAKVGINDSNINYDLESITSIPLTDGKRMFYNITDTEKQFIGVEGKDGKVDKGSVIFKFLNNGEKFYNSGIMKAGDPAKEIDVKIKRGTLEMIVDDAGDGKSGDHAVWIHPKINYFEIPPIMVAYDYIGETPVQSKEINTKLKKLLAALPAIKTPLKQPEYDWLIDNEKAKAEVYRSDNGKDIIISNGLVARVFRLFPNLATVDYVNQMTGESLLRSVSNEGTLIIDGKEYAIGGLKGQPEFAYTLLEWIDDMTIDPNSFLIEDFRVKEVSDRLEWKRVRWASNPDMPSGKELIFTLSKDDIVVKVHYVMLAFPPLASG